MPMTQKEMIRLLEKNGFVVVKGAGKGSHVKMTKAGITSPIIIPKGD